MLKPEEWSPRGVESLEPRAEAVVRSTSNALVTAGPGAGKTELLAQRACYLLETGGCKYPRRILAISFKRDAAKNLADRVAKRCGELASRFDSMTLDAFGKSITDRFLSAIPVEWQPRPGFEVMVKPLSISEMRDWFLSVSFPEELPKPDFRSISDEKIKIGFESIMFGVPLPYYGAEVTPLTRFLGLTWWRQRLTVPKDVPSLMFPMINRLAAYLLRLNPKITKALRATYSHVFLDEFQDTTAAQYDLVQAAFLGSESVLTAVGDSKQRIMIWAGAMQEAFVFFKRDFSAEDHHLVRNYRSAPNLVSIQHSIAQALESGTPRSEASRIATGGECYIAEFKSAQQEARYLADMFATDIAANSLRPRDFCVLARQQAGTIAAQLQLALSAKNVRLRDESLLQDLLAEPLTQLIVGALRLISRKRDPEAWEFVQKEIAHITGLDQIVDAAKIDVTLSALLKAMRANAAASKLDFTGLPGCFVEQIGEKVIRGAYRQYSNAKFLSDRVKQLGTALATEQARTLKAAVDGLVGTNIVPAMTVHKSKGLEFDTVVFLGLEDSQLWNFAKQSDEEKRGFFVALSRAISRVVFTFSDVRDGKYGPRKQGRIAINDLYTMLQKAGVPIIDCRGY